MCKNCRKTFSSKFRISSQEIFREVLKSKCKISGTCFFLRSRKNENIFPRLGIVASKRNFSKSVHRNYLKRIVREVFRNLQDRLPSRDYVMYFYSCVLEVDHLKLRRSMEDCFLSSVKKNNEGFKVGLDQLGCY